MVDYKLANVIIDAAYSPRVTIYRCTGDEGYKVVLTVDGPLTSDQIEECTIGGITIISIDDLKFTGVVTGFGTRIGYSVCQIDEAICSI